MSDHAELIERLRAATGADSDLDADIYAGVVRRDLAGTRGKGGGLAPKNQFHEAGGEGLGWHYPPPYTASLDAAMTLVPDGMHWGCGTWSGNFGNVEKAGDYKSDYTAEHVANPAIALTIAALRARATLASENPHG